MACRASEGPGGGGQGPALRHHAGRRGRRRRDGGHRPSRHAHPASRSFSGRGNPSGDQAAPGAGQSNAPGSSAARSTGSYGLAPISGPFPAVPVTLPMVSCRPACSGRSRGGCSRLPTPAASGPSCVPEPLPHGFLGKDASSSATLCRRARDLRHVGRRRRGFRLREGVYVLHGDPR